MLRLHPRVFLAFTLAFSLTVGFIAITTGKAKILDADVRAIFTESLGEKAPDNSTNQTPITPPSHQNAKLTDRMMEPVQASAVAPTGDPGAGFDIEGNLVANSPNADTTDWVPGPAGSGEGIFTASGVAKDTGKSFRRVDAYNSNGDNVFKPGLKANDNPNNWSWGLQKAAANDDINNGLLHISTDRNENLWMVVAADRLNNDGDTFLDFEFLQNTLTANTNGTFTTGGSEGGRTVGDLLLTIKLSQSEKPQFFVQRWQIEGQGFNWVDLAIPEGLAYVATNAGTVPVAFGAFGSTNYPLNSFGEAALNVSELLQKISPCLAVKTLLIKSRSSQEATAAVLDFLEPIQVNLGTVPFVAVNSETICAAGTATLTATVSGGKTPYSFVWTGPSDFSAKTQSINVSTPGTYRVTVLDANQCASQTALGTVNITSAASVNAGVDIATCAANPAVVLGGIVGGGATGGVWSGGKGTFSPDANTLNATYTPTMSEIKAGSVTLRLTTTGPCTRVSDTMNIIIATSASARAGADQTVCAVTPSVKLAGAIGGATGGQWTSSGTGTFTPNATTLNATYTPSAADIAARSVTLTLTTTGGSCGTGKDEMKITINPAVTVNAGADRAVCAGNPAVALAGQIGGSATIGTWSGGAGTFSPNANTLNATYTPTAAEIAAGTVTLTLTTNNPAGPCGAYSDQMAITFNSVARANAGPDQTVCAASPAVSLSGSISGAASGATWTGGGGVFTPNANHLNATYTPSAAEVAAGGVTLTLMTNDPDGSCGAASDQVRINIVPTASVNAGADRTVCATSPSVGLTGSVGAGATSGVWSGGGGTFTPNASTLNATYTPSAAEIAAGSATLTLTTNDPPGPCGPSSDQMKITINPAAIVNAGPDQSVCGGTAGVVLAGSIGGSATSATWSGGTGTFSPNNTTFNATYMPSAAEIAAKTVTLTLTTNDPAGICGPTNDKVVINFTSAPPTTITAPDAVCTGSTGNTASVPSGGAGAGYNWTITNGTITGGQNTPNITWTAGSSGTTTLSVNVTAGGSCSASGTKQATITSTATAAAGADQTVCQSASGPTVFNLTGSVSGGTPVWSVVNSNGPLVANIPSPNSANTAVSVTGEGIVRMRLTVNGQNGCGTATDEVVLAVIPPPAANAGVDQTLCQSAGGTTSFNLTGAATNGLPGSPAWSVVGATGSAAASIVSPNNADTAVNVTGTGTVTLRFTAASNSQQNCGTASDDLVLTVNNALAATITAPAAVCADSTGNTASVPDAGAGAGYNWTISGGTITGGQGTPNVTWTAGSSGTATLSASITAPGGCNASNSSQVAINAAAVSNAGVDQTVCRAPSDPTIVTVNGSASGGTPQWSVVGATGTALATIVSPNSPTTTVNVTGAGTLTLRLTVTSTSNPSCGTTTDDIVLTVNTCAPPVGPGLVLPATAEMSDQKAGSVLIYNIYTSNPIVPAQQNTRINITNIHQLQTAAVHLFFIDGDSCSVADSFLCLTRNQTTSFTAADFDPGTTGFLIAVAVDPVTGCPANFNYLIGDEYVKFSSGHAANLQAEAISALPGALQTCDENSPIASLDFDGISYNRLPRALALDDIPSRADGNDTLIIINRIGGNLGLGTSPLGTLFGIVYNDSENSSSFNITGGCQLRGVLSGNFPRTVPRIEQFIPAGRSGWMKFWIPGDPGDKGITGAVINNNPNAATSVVAYTQGRNLHKLTLDSTSNFVIPVFPPPCR